MRHEKQNQDLVPDAELGAALQSLAGEPPLEAVDWQELRASINARAELPLARRRAGRTRQPSRGWRPLIPIVLAASIVLAVWMGGDGDSPETVAGTQLSAEDVFRDDLSEQEFRLLVSGRANAEELLLIALDEQ